MTRGPWLIALVCGSFACGDDLEVTLRVVPSTGIAPLEARLEASVEGAKEGAKLRYRFDLNGDGTYDTEPAEAPVAEFTFGQGPYRPWVEVIDEKGDTHRAFVDITVDPNQPPVPVLEVAPAMGRQPLAVTLDSSKSSDPEGEDPPLEARYDFDADGKFDTEWAPVGSASHVYSVVGAHAPTVEVRDWRGGVASTAASVTVLPGLDLDADMNRDGRISDEDDLNEDVFSTTSGAVFLANVDDDDGDGVQDFRDDVVSGIEDVQDMARLMVRQYQDLPSSSTVRLAIEPAAAASNIRIFGEDGGGNLVEVYAPGSGETALDAGRMAAGDITLYVEGLSGWTQDWDGRAEITLTAERGDDGAIESDKVAMRVAPVIFPDNTRPAETLYVMEITIFDLGPNVPFYRGVMEHTPSEVEIYTVDQIEYLGDRWVQDNMQTGYQVMPTDTGMHVMQTYLETVRSTGDDGLEYLVTDELHGQDHGYFFTGGGETSLNYGGNLEITPPYVDASGTEHPFGRILVGGGAGGTILGRAYEDHMTSRQRAFLDAQIQGPTLELSSEWLLVGHIDEIFLFLPNPSRHNGRDFVVLFASPMLAVSSLEELEAAGLSSEVVFPGRRTQTTVGAILQDDAFLSYQEAVQARIDSVREKLMAEMALTDADILEVPVLYEAHRYFGDDYSAAYVPGIQNLVVLNQTLLVPDPEGPTQNGTDIWQRMTREVLEPLGVTVHFVDVFDSYHLNLGEAHCGTGVRHAPYDAAWWEKE